MSGSGVMEFARAVFGVEKANTALQARKDEMKGPETANGGHGEGYSCRALMRAYVLLRGEMDEVDNAEELMTVAKGYFPSDVVARELAVVLMEMR